MRNVLPNNKNNKQVSEPLHAPLRHSEAAVQSEIHNLARNRKSKAKAQFRRRASAVPNLIVIWFDCSTAGKQL